MQLLSVSFCDKCIQNIYCQFFSFFDLQDSYRWKDAQCVSFPLEEIRKEYSNLAGDRKEPSYAHINKSGHIKVDRYVC